MKIQVEFVFLTLFLALGCIHLSSAATNNDQVNPFQPGDESISSSTIIIRELKKSKKDKKMPNSKSKQVKSGKKKKMKKMKPKNNKKKKKKVIDNPVTPPKKVNPATPPTPAPSLAPTPPPFEDDDYDTLSSDDEGGMVIWSVQEDMDPAPPLVADGIPQFIVERAVKAAATAQLSRAGPGWTEMDGVTLGSIVDLKSVFSEDAIYIPYSENRTTGVDDALLVEDDGQCFLAFQATVPDVNDVLDNADRRVDQVCNAAGECCLFRKGYVDAWNNEFKEQLLADVKDCISRCDPNSDEPCLVLGGHSQGGAIANTAFMELSDMTSSYESYTFGAPRSLVQHPDTCSPFDPTRFYRFGKGLYKGGAGGGLSGMVFDWVPFFGPIGVDYDTYAVGPFFILSSEDSSNVAYVGMNSNHPRLEPFDYLPPPFGDAHYMYKDPDLEFPGTGYFNLLKKMRDENTEADSFPIQINGFENGSHCSLREDAQIELLCESKRCNRVFGEVHPTCNAQLESGQGCSNDYDCLSNSCTGRWRKTCD